MRSAPSPDSFCRPNFKVLPAVILALVFHFSTIPGYTEKVNALTDEQVAQNQALARKLLKNMKPGQRSINLGCMDLHVDQVRRLAGDERATFIMDTGTPPFTRYWPNGDVLYAFNPPGIEDGTIDA